MSHERRRMPTRLLKDSICTSKDINRLTNEEEILFYRLIVNCDDYGYLEADPEILRSRCFPRRIDLITDEIMCKWLQSLVKKEMVAVFESSGNFYLRLPSWEKHQQVRAKRRKYPEMNGDCRVLLESDITCKHLLSDENKCTRNPIQSNPVVIQSESNPILEKVVSLYNEICTTLPKAKTIKDSRLKHLQGRLKDYPDIKTWEGIFNCVVSDDFLSGRNGKWKGCCFDWIIKQENCTKLYERSLQKEEHPSSWQ